MDWLSYFTVPLGRICISAIFLVSGIGKLGNFAGTKQYMASAGLPDHDALLTLGYILAVIFELAGGLSVLLGWQVRWGALMLLVFLLIVTPIFHDFWAQPPEQQRNQMIHFMKNLAIAGGLLVVLGHGAGPVSIDARQVAVGTREAA